MEFALCFSRFFTTGKQFSSVQSNCCIYSFCLLTLMGVCFLLDAVSTSAYSSPAKSLGDPGITPLSPSHIAVRNVLLLHAYITFSCLFSGT